MAEQFLSTADESFLTHTPSQATLAGLWKAIQAITPEEKDGDLFGQGVPENASLDASFFTARIHPYPDRDPHDSRFKHGASLLLDSFINPPTEVKLWYRDDYNSANGVFYQARGATLTNEETLALIDTLRISHG